MLNTHHPWRILLALTALALSAWACASTPDIPSQPLNKGVNLSGQWYSPQYEKMTIEQKGAKIIGSFTYKTGGVFEGELQDNVLYFSWEQPGDFKVARRHVGGRGYLVFSPDGATFKGRWGYDDALDSGGAWDGERILEAEINPQEGPIFGR
jgi:hypothetical protein